ncbi:MAG: cellulase family glycosylhydrolase [Clostridia bacterium]|nr:cellulase family glycosylhydrolase [Clostridia bacterium]
MKKTLKSVLSLILAFVLAFSVCSVALAAETVEEATGFTDEDFLTTNKRKLVNRNGDEIQLKGVNLGSWMIWEDWLSPYEEATDHYSVLETLEKRFGREAAYELFNTYMDNWITEYDLDEIKKMGFNCVRVPFWFRNFYYDDNGTKILDENGEWDFSRLEWVVRECSERELYVILDMHGAVGYHSDAPHSGKGQSCGYYEDTEQGEKYRQLTDELWAAIAEKFEGNPAVAMYDLLNEPMCDVPSGELERRKNNTMAYTRLYDAVRAVDEDHIITMECIWTAFALPQAWTKGWDNVVYQVHFYNNSNFIFNLFAFFTKLVYFDVPMYMGEFYPHQKTTWENCFNTLNNLDYSWTLWTYKATGHGMWSSDWCIKGSKDGFHRVKVQTDSYEEIARKWGECIRTENGFQDTGHYDNNVKNNL